MVRWPTSDVPGPERLSDESRFIVRAGSAAVAMALGATVFTSACLVVTWIAGRPTPASVSIPLGPVFASIEEVEFDNNQAAQLEATIVEGSVVRSPGGGNLVTEVAVSAGEEVRGGLPLYSVDGVAVWAVAGGTPLYRALGPNDKGADVEALQAFLNSYFGDDRLDVTGEIDIHTQQAIREWQRATGMATDGTIRPEQFALISGAFVAGEVRVVVGMPSPALGDVVLTGVDRLGSIQVSGPADTVGGDYSFLVSGRSVAIRFDGREWTPADGDETLALAMEFDTTSSQEASDSSGGPGSEGQAASHQVVIEGRLALATPIVVAGLPPGALAPGSADHACAWLLREDVSDVEMARIRESGLDVEGFVEIVEGLDVAGISLAGSALVTGSAPLGGRNVLLDPGSFLDTSACR
ncbi:MAG: peptidoglycan-binding protein [Bifidobacteriaceae bacterium]|nr:peptidoglycan-binding protein [Bifidobacteriaceae bacterium]